MSSKRYVALLRGINVSGKNKIKMAELRELLTTRNLTSVTTYLQSGNVAFNSNEPDPTKLETLIKSVITQEWGFDVPILIREQAEIKRIIDQHPFATKEDQSALYVTFLQERATPENLAKLILPPTETTEFTIGERELFIYCPDGYGNTKLSNRFIERKLKLTATTRNWRTVNKIYHLLND